MYQGRLLQFHASRLVSMPVSGLLVLAHSVLSCRSPRYLSDTRSTVLLGALRMRQLSASKILIKSDTVGHGIFMSKTLRRVQPNTGCSVTALVKHVYADLQLHIIQDVVHDCHAPYSTAPLHCHSAQAARIAILHMMRRVRVKQLVSKSTSGTRCAIACLVQTTRNEGHQSLCKTERSRASRALSFKRC